MFIFLLGGLGQIDLLLWWNSHNLLMGWTWLVFSLKGVLLHGLLINIFNQCPLLINSWSQMILKNILVIQFKYYHLYLFHIIALVYCTVEDYGISIGKSPFGFENMWLKGARFMERVLDGGEIRILKARLNKSWLKNYELW